MRLLPPILGVVRQRMTWQRRARFLARQACRSFRRRSRSSLVVAILGGVNGISAIVAAVVAAVVAVPCGMPAVIVARVSRPVAVSAPAPLPHRRRAANAALNGVLTIERTSHDGGRPDACVLPHVEQANYGLSISSTSSTGRSGLVGIPLTFAASNCASTLWWRRDARRLCARM